MPKFLTSIIELIYIQYQLLVGMWRSFFKTQHSLTLMMGLPGTRKTVTYNQIKQPRTTVEKEFQETNLQGNDYIVDCPSLDFENIDAREEFIVKFQKFYDYEMRYKSTISSICIFVNFDRLDTMKNKFISIYKYLEKQSQRILMAVTDFQLSEEQNKEQDKQDIINKFKIYFKNIDPKNRILFISRSTSSVALKDEIISKVQGLPSSDQFSLKNTIFEKISEEEEKKIMRNFKFTH